MNHRLLKLILVFLLCLHSVCFLSACSLSRSSSQPEITSLSDAKDRTGKAPVEVQIKSASKDEGLLKVAVTLKPFTKLHTKDVAVALVGLRGDKIVEKQSSMLNALVGERILEKSEKVDVEFVLSAANLTDYQVKCSWGQDAEILANQKKKRETKIISAIETSPEEEALVGTSSSAAPKTTHKTYKSNEELSRSSLKADDSETLQEQVASAFNGENNSYKFASELRIKSIKKIKKILSCESPPCDFQYVLDAIVENNLDYEVNEVSLGVGLYWKSAGKSELSFPNPGDPISENEELIKEKISIAPGQSQTISVELDRAIPDVAGGEFVPHLRIINAL